ncbi:6-bladed beta-propeller [Bacteroides bouchesdurhonensis]
MLNHQNYTFPKIFEQVEYIPLETTDSSLVGIVERL